MAVVTWHKIVYDHQPCSLTQERVSYVHKKLRYMQMKFVMSIKRDHRLKALYYFIAKKSTFVINVRIRKISYIACFMHICGVAYFTNMQIQKFNARYNVIIAFNSLTVLFQICCICTLPTFCTLSLSDFSNTEVILSTEHEYEYDKIFLLPGSFFQYIQKLLLLKSYLSYRK